MKDFISAPVLIPTLYAGSIVGHQILKSVEQAALAKAGSGLPRLSNLSRALTTRKEKQARESGHCGKRLAFQPCSSRAPTVGIHRNIEKKLLAGVSDLRSDRVHIVKVVKVKVSEP